MNKPISLTVKEVRKRQVLTAILFIGSGVMFSFIAQKLGIGVWWLAALWVLIGLFLAFVFPQISKAIVCPACRFPLDRVAGLVENYGVTLHSCPACGYRFSEDESIAR